MNNKLLPLNTRVTHFDGSPGTHGKGTIVAYNATRRGAYLEEKPEQAINLAAKVGMLDGLVNSFYSSDRYPYVVHFDPSEKYPEGYKDVYCDGSINEIKESE